MTCVVHDVFHLRTYVCMYVCRNRLVTRHIWTREDESELSDLFEQYKDDSGE